MAPMNTSERSNDETDLRTAAALLVVAREGSAGAARLGQNVVCEGQISKARFRVAHAETCGRLWTHWHDRLDHIFVTS